MAHAHVYGNNELIDMLLIYGETHQNSEAASRLYAERFPNRVHPAGRRFVALVQRARDTGELGTHRGRDAGRNRPRRIINVEEQILDIFANDPTSSTRGIGRQLGVSNKVVWRTLKEDMQHPFHYQRVQSLQPEDYPRRVNFCEWILRQHELNQNFLNEILFTDETTFTRNGIFNHHNYHHWGVENPHLTKQTNFQHRFSINLWGGVVNGVLLGLHELPPRLDGLSYLEFLRNDLDELLEDLPLGIRQRMFFMHDGAPIHYRAEVREFLNGEYPQKWIGRGGPIPWPPRSPDLNVMDFFVWGFLKNLVYAPPNWNIENREILREKINNAVQQMRQQGSFQRACDSLLRRARLCIESGGGNFEHLL